MKSPNIIINNNTISMQNIFNTSEAYYMNLELHEEDSFADLKFDVIWNNQVLEAKDKLPDFDIREASQSLLTHPSHSWSQGSCHVDPILPACDHNKYSTGQERGYHSPNGRRKFRRC